jgi:hypothetical protein
LVKNVDLKFTIISGVCRIIIFEWLKKMPKGYIGAEGAEKKNMINIKYLLA